jgi:4-hydroxybenzoate polyprenyltransferase
MALRPSEWLRLARPRQWSKNLLVLAALIFAVRFREPGDLLLAFEALVAFVLLSASVYALNDLLDRESDRRHPLKKLRPVASGAVSPAEAAVLAGLWAGLGLGLSFWLGMDFMACAAAYLAVSTAYSLWTKHQVILDVFSLSAGFVLRAAAGALVLHVPISEWLLVCSTLLALFLGLSKRRGELVALEGKPALQRRALDHYSLPLLDKMINIVASVTLMAYALYAVSAHTATHGPWMLLTVPFVLYGIFRYLYLADKKGLGSAPELVLLGDRALQVNLVLWVLCSAAILARAS